MTADLLELCAELVDIPSVSHHEAAIADHLEALVGAVPGLGVDRVGNTVVARTQLGRPGRLILAGHTDTVPANGNERARREDDVLWGLGAADMKAGVAVFLQLARTVTDPAVDVTYVFYECEEVESRHNGVRRLFAERPDLVAGDAAVLGEPTAARVEAGCQGTMRLEVVVTGERAHTARPWMGRNAIHRLGAVLAAADGYVERRPVLDGCEFREALQAVKVVGGVAGNVVPDRARVVLNHRFAPDRSPEEAEAHVREVLAGTLDETAGDELRLVDAVPGAPPALDHPLLAELVERVGERPVAKLGWTDVAFFAAHGVPALNFGPGDPLLAHTAGERVESAALDRVYAVLAELLTA